MSDITKPVMLDETGQAIAANLLLVKQAIENQGNGSGGTLTGKGAPTTATEGAVGMLYMDTDTGELYKCTAVADGAYTWGKVGSGDAVLYTAQTLTEEQKAQARENIGAAGNAVLYTSQTITSEQQAQARANIGAGTVKSVNGNAADANGNVQIETNAPTDEQVSTAVEAYLDAHPDVASGAADIIQSIPATQNLLNRATCAVGIVLGNDGTTTTNNNYETTDYIAVDENTSYVISAAAPNSLTREIVYYDENKAVLSGTPYFTNPHKTPVRCAFVRISFHKSNTDVQFEKGDTATNYVAYSTKNVVAPSAIPQKAVSLAQTNFSKAIAAGKNLLNLDACINGYYLDSSTGKTEESPNSILSDFIPCTIGDTIAVSGVTSSLTPISAIIFYDADKKYSRGIGVSEMKEKYSDGLIFPVKAFERYVRISFGSTNTEMMVEYGTEITEYEPFVGTPAINAPLYGFRQSNDAYLHLNPWQNKRLIVDGDSITHDQGLHNYWQFVAAEIMEMYIEIDSSGGYVTGHKGTAGSRIADELGVNDPSQSIVLRYMDLPDEADLVMIAGGTNDWAHSNVDLGDFDSTDTTTFNGALNVLLPGLKAKYPKIPVVMMTPIKRGIVYNAENSKGLTLEQFVDAMIAKCRQYGVYCLDMYSNCPINPQIPAMKELLFNANDDTHPNTEGHKVMGKTVAGFIRTLN